MLGREKKQGLFGLGPREAAASGTPAKAPRTALPAAHAAAQSYDEAAILRMNLKALAGASAFAPVRYATREDAALEPVGVMSRPPLIADVTRPGFAYWCEALRCAVRPHRKLWEFSQVLQAFYEHGVLTPGARTLGFGVGDEPIPSYLASLGLHVVATDLAGVTDREDIWRPNMIDEADFDARVEVSDVDFRRTDDATLRGFDGIWSCSLVDQLSTVDAAHEKIIEAMDTLKPGGVAVHTTEFAFADDIVMQKPGFLRFPQQFFQRVTDTLNGLGHKAAPLKFNLGQHPLDAYIDLEPYVPAGAEAFETLWREGLGAPHLKVISEETPTTSFAIVVSKRL